MVDKDAFDTSKGNEVAALILFPLALCGFICNLTVIIFKGKIPSLKNSFGSLTFSQAVADCIHQAIFAFYLSPCIFLRIDSIYSISEQFGFTLITVYNICGTAHVCISVNRFVAVYAPFIYHRVFSTKNTRILIGLYWLFGIGSTTYLLKMIDCFNYLPRGTWIFGFKDSPTCNIVLWYIEFIKYVVYVAIVAILDSCSIVKIHYMHIRHQKLAKNSTSVTYARSERNLVYQAALQGIFFLVELITYFILSPYARNKWEAFLLTTVSWCLVHGMDGFIVLTCNTDFRRELAKRLWSRPIVYNHSRQQSGPSRSNARTNSTNQEYMQTDF